VEGPKNGSYFLRYWGSPDGEGKRSRCAIEIGLKGQFNSKEEASYSIEAAKLRRRINAGAIGRTVGQIAAEFERDAMPKRANTRATDLTCLRHIVKKWDTEPIAGLTETTESKRLEGWLDRMRRFDGSQELSYSAKKNVRQQMATLFDFAMKQGYIPTNVNPMERVHLVQREEPRRRQKLSPKLLDLFFASPDIPEYVKVIAHVAKRTGFRISEILGLKKEDFDLDSNLVTVRRRIYREEIAGPKSKKSGDPVPFDEELFRILSAWLKSPGNYPNFEGWLFCSPMTRRPYSADGMQLSHLRPFGLRHGIEKFGWHSFRHGFKDYLKEAETPLDEIKRLMRHSKIQTTDGYGSESSMETLRRRQAAAIALMERPAVEPKKRKWA
jgi:integrase